MPVRRLKPTEYKAVLALLEEDADDVLELAKEIVRTINRMRAEEEAWVRVVRWGTGYLMWGPYPTADAARRDTSARSPSKTEPVEIRLWRLIPPGSGEVPTNDEEREQ